MRCNKQIQTSQSVPKIVETQTVSTECNPKRFFVKYTNLVDLLGNEGKWYEAEKEDCMLPLECIKCRQVFLMRKDEPICISCKPEEGETV